MNFEAKTFLPENICVKNLFARISHDICPKKNYQNARIFIILFARKLIKIITVKRFHYLLFCITLFNNRIIIVLVLVVC